MKNCSAAVIPFYLPWFQRGYAWTEDLADRLLTDIRQAERDGAHRYRIGRMMLAGRVREKGQVLVDGHQRTVTLMITFALLRSMLPQRRWQDRLTPLLEARRIRDGARFRLTPQPTIATFFSEHIQLKGAIDNDGDLFNASEVEHNILNNRAKLRERLVEFADSDGGLEALADYLLTRCLFVVEFIGDESEAWNMLQTEEATGLPFHDSARAKVTLIETMRTEEREVAGKLWDRCQAQLGDDGMQQLLRHIRDLSRRRRSTQPVEKDIVTSFALYRDGLAFMNEHLVPAADRLIALRRQTVGHGKDHERISRNLRHMEWAGHRLWCPPAMRWLQVNGDRDPATAEFFDLLARKVWMLRISGADAVEHERRFISLSNEIAQGLAPGSFKELSDVGKLAAKCRENLLSRTFFDKRYSRPVLRFLCDLLGSDPGEIDGACVTVEHVLPRNPNRNSTWRKDFGSRRAISEYAHRLGNLAFLSFADNQKVGNNDYAEKRAYLKGSGFALSVDAAAVPKWTPDVVMARSERLVKEIFDHWQLPM